MYVCVRACLCARECVRARVCMRMCVCRTCKPSALKCSSPLCLQRVVPLPTPLPTALGERQGESSRARASRAPRARRALLAELSAACSALPASGWGWTLGFCVPVAAVGWRAPNPGACRLSLASTHGERSFWWKA